MLDYNPLLKRQNLIIFLLVAFLAIQGFALTEIYKVNFPYVYDMTSIRIFLDYMYPDESYSIANFVNELLTDTNERSIIFPKLLVAPNYLLNNFDSNNIFYLNWILISLTLFMFFLIIKHHNTKLYWTLIPISAFLFSPLVNNNYWNYTITIWYFTGFCIVTSIYFFTKKYDFRRMSGAIIFAIMATYSIPLGLPIWIAGSVIMLKSIFQKKTHAIKLTLTFFSSMGVIGTIYYLASISEQEIISLSNFFSLDSFFVFNTFLSVPYKLKFPELMIITGFISFLISLLIIFYLGFLRKKINELFPWILFLIVGASAAILMRIGRNDSFFEGNFPYYSPVAGLFQIGLCLLIGVLILDIKKQNKFKRKNLLLFFLYSIIICQMIFMIPSYYSGWQKADYYYDEKLRFIECFSLHHDWIPCEKMYEHSLDQNKEFYKIFKILNYFIENNSNIFSENPNLNNETQKELLYFSELIQTNDKISVEGKILSVNYNDVKQEKSITISDQSVIISGIISETNLNKIDTLYLLINSKAAAKFDNLNHYEIQEKNVNSELFWTFALLKNYIPTGCNEIQIAGLMNDKPFVINNIKEICT